MSGVSNNSGVIKIQSLVLEDILRFERSFGRHLRVQNEWDCINFRYPKLSKTVERLDKSEAGFSNQRGGFKRSNELPFKEDVRIKFVEVAEDMAKLLVTPSNISELRHMIHN